MTLDGNWIMKVEMIIHAPSSEVFSFGCIACHIITQKWGRINSRQLEPDVVIVPEGFQSPLYIDAKTMFMKLVRVHPVRQLIASCLVHNEKRRPSITMVYETITDVVTSNILI